MGHSYSCGLHPIVQVPPEELRLSINNQPMENSGYGTRIGQPDGDKYFFTMTKAERSVSPAGLNPAVTEWSTVRNSKKELYVAAPRVGTGNCNSTLCGQSCFVVGCDYPSSRVSEVKGFVQDYLVGSRDRLE